MLLACLSCAIFTRAEAGPPSLDASPNKGDFNLVASDRAADLYVDSADFKVVQISGDCLAADVERVTGIKPRVISDPRRLSGDAVLIGTIGHSALIDGLVRAGKLDVKPITGKWESYTISTVKDPMPGVSAALVIAGSDRRGTAYGSFDLSEAIGVSPWVWWADVKPRHRDALAIAAGTHIQGPPSVKYRGIFINDEDWSMQPWAAKTFEPETGDIGPKTYAKVCELLLRLKANYLWPAMHPCTKAFNLYPQDKVVADDYAIVMGSSHAEPMLRDNVTEWDPATRGEWDYDKNRAGILTYWEQRVQENSRYENVYTIGMRGIHDSAMPGGGTIPDQVARLQRVIGDQRQILARDVSPDVGSVPQIFVPYKEVLALYQHGLKVPPDVTLVWPDDNHGYIRELSTPEEQKRPGGAGVYYHVSYWGAPEDYLWLCTTPPALIWEEMRKAYDNGARTVWVLNVGGLKKSAIDMEFFLRMAWNIDAWNENAQPAFLDAWAAENFGGEHASEIAAIMNEYYRLNYPSRPEHLLRAQFADYEKQDRLQRFGLLVNRTNALLDKLPSSQKNPFYELVVYPVRCSALMNEKILSANPVQAQLAYDQIQAETQYYNEQVAGGKWNLMMPSSPRGQPVFQKPPLTVKPASGSALPPPPYIRISIDAAHPARSTAEPGAAWKVLAGLGRAGDSITLWPTTAAVTGTARLEYSFTVPKPAVATVLVYCIPTHSLNPAARLRYSVTLDDQPPKIIAIDTVEFSPAWSVNVLRGAAIGSALQGPVSPNDHKLTLRPLDPGVVFDKIEVDLTYRPSS